MLLLVTALGAAVVPVQSLQGAERQSHCTHFGAYLLLNDVDQIRRVFEDFLRVHNVYGVVPIDELWRQ